MIIDEILAEITTWKPPYSSSIFSSYQDMVAKASNLNPVKIYSDKSRSIDDIIAVMGMITTEKSPLLSMLNGFLLNRKTNGIQVSFEDGFCTPSHTHNYAELGYVMEGQFHTVIDGQDFQFNKGELFLIDKNITHYEKLFRKNSIVLFLSIMNTFFDISIHHDVYDTKSEKFIGTYIKGGGYNFVQFAPKDNNCQIPGLFEKILSEIWRPHPGTRFLIMGYVEWILNLLPIEYRLIVHGNDKNTSGALMFKKVRDYIESHYIDTTLNDLIKKFGHNMNYFNTLTKKYTGMSYSAFVQDIKLEKAKVLFTTTDFPVEEVIRKVGYKNLSFFYKKFREKYSLTPNELRNQKNHT